MVIGKLSVLLGLNSAQFQTGMQAAANNVRTFRAQIAGSATILSTFTSAVFRVSSAIAAFYLVIGAARPALAFEQAMASSTAIMDEMSLEMRLAMEQTAKDVAMTTKFTAAEAAQAYYALASAGMDAAQMIEALPQVAMFAQAGMFDLSQAADLAASAQAALGLAVDDPKKNLENLARVTDVLTEANNAAIGTVEDFAVALNTKAAAAMRIVGMEVEEGVAVLAAFAKQGTLGEEAGTQFAIVMRDLQTKAIENAAVFDALGVKVFDASGNMQNMADIIGNLETVLSGMSDETKKATLLQLGFQDRSVAAMMALIGMSDEIREYEERLKKASGATAEVAGKQLPTFTRGWKELKTVFERLSVVIITPLLEALGVVLGWVAKGLNVVATWLEVLRERSMRLGEAIANRIRRLLGMTATETDKVGKAAENAAPAIGTAADKARELNEVVGDTPDAMAAASDAVTDFIKSLEADLQFRGMHDLERRLEELWEAGDFEVTPGYIDFEAYNRARAAVDELMGLERDMEEFKRRSSEHESLMSRGASLTESLMTPMEAFSKRQADANRLLQVGAISWETYGREIAAAREELIRLQAVEKGPGLVERGSQEDYAAITAWQSRMNAMRAMTDAMQRDIAAAAPKPIEPVVAAAPEPVAPPIVIEPMVEIEPAIARSEPAPGRGEDHPATPDRSDAGLTEGMRELAMRVADLRTVMAKVEENTRSTSASSNRAAKAMERTAQPALVDM